MTTDFPAVAYETVHARVTRRKDAVPDVWGEYAGAWNAVCYRYLACLEHDARFTQSILTGGSAPRPPERYIQEKELFGFFVTGLSAIESLCYGFFAIGTLLKPADFPIKTEKEKAAITPKKTAEAYMRAFPREQITEALEVSLSSREYQEWYAVRNVLAHRTAPPRLHKVGAFQVDAFQADAFDMGGTFWIRDIRLDAGTTAKRCEWWTRAISALMAAADSFTARYFED